MNHRVILRKLILPALAGAVLAGGAQAQEPVYYISPGLNLLEFDQENMLEKREVGFTYSLGIDFDRRWSAEFEYMEAEPAFAESLDKADLETWEVGLRYTFGQPGDRLRPYVGAAVGNFNVEGDSDTLLNYGAGLEFELRDRWVLRAGMNRFDFLSRDSDIGFNAGLAYYFGQRNAPRPPPPQPSAPPPEPIAVAPPPDSDGDGVLDPQDDCPNTPSNYAVDEDGCPILIEEIASFELQVNFDFDESVIRDADVPEIEGLAEFMREYDGVMLELEGHTDSIGTPLYNLDLSQRRADAVRDMLIEDFGISSGRITAQGFGEQLPVADNDTEAGREANRRVVATVSETLQRYQER